MSEYEEGLFSFEILPSYCPYHGALAEDCEHLHEPTTPSHPVSAQIFSGGREPVMEYCGLCNGWLRGAPCHQHLIEAEEEVRALRKLTTSAVPLIEYLAADYGSLKND